MLALLETWSGLGFAPITVRGETRFLTHHNSPQKYSSPCPRDRPPLKMKSQLATFGSPSATFPPNGYMKKALLVPKFLRYFQIVFVCSSPSGHLFTLYASSFGLYLDSVWMMMRGQSQVRNAENILIVRCINKLPSIIQERKKKELYA